MTGHFGPPVLTFADVGWMTPELTLRKQRQLAEAACVVCPVEFLPPIHDTSRSPLAIDLDRFELDFETQYFKVFRRRPVAAP